MKEIGLAGPKKDHLFCAIHKANEIGGAQAERILEKTSEKNTYTFCFLKTILDFTNLTFQTGIFSQFKLGKKNQTGYFKLEKVKNS